MQTKKIMSVTGLDETEGTATLAERSTSSRSDCTDCSHCSNRSQSHSKRSRAGIRVSINLRQFFSDQRAHAFMWAPYGRCVQWLSRRIARVFGLSDNIALMCRGHMLPKDEPLLLLHRRDPVEVVNMSYLLTPINNKDDSNLSSHRSTKEISASTGPSQTNLCPIESSLTFKRENVSQLLSSEDNNITENLHVSRLDYPTDDMEAAGESAENHSLDTSEDLQRLKQHALRLLDEHCHMLQEVSAPKRLRRRRRRRRPLQAAARAEAVSGDEELQSSEAVLAVRDAGATVLRNGSGSRPPRLVHALSPPPI